MKISEIIQRVQKTEQNKEWVDTEKLGYDLGIYHMEYVEQDRITSYFFASWMCTDTVVGYRVYFFDDVPVMVSTQTARKSDEEYAWISRDYAQQVKEYLLSLLHEDDSLNIMTLDLEYDFGDYFNIDFNSQKLSCHKFYYDNTPVEIVHKTKHTLVDAQNWKEYHIGNIVNIKLDDGAEKKVEIGSLKIPFYLKE